MVALAEPSKEAEPVASPEIAKVLDVSRAVAVAALPEVFWLPAWFTPGRLMSPVPSKETPPIVLALSRALQRQRFQKYLGYQLGLHQEG